jgi:hypothetical protein
VKEGRGNGERSLALALVPHEDVSMCIAFASVLVLYGFAGLASDLCRYRF